MLSLVNELGLRIYGIAHGEVDSVVVGYTDEDVKHVCHIEYDEPELYFRLNNEKYYLSEFTRY